MSQFPSLLPKNTPSNLPAPLPSPRKAQLNPVVLKEPLVALVRDPDKAWLAIRSESTTAVALFERYVFLLAAIPAISGTVGFIGFGWVSPYIGVTYGIVGYLLCLGFLYGATYLAHLIAPMFDGKLTLDNSAKLIVYSFMPFFVSGIFFICPPLSFLALAGLYAIVLFYKGIPVMTGIPPRKQLTFFMINAVSWILFAEFMRWAIFVK